MVKQSHCKEQITAKLYINVPVEMCDLSDQIVLENSHLENHLIKYYFVPKKLKHLLTAWQLKQSLGIWHFFQKKIIYFSSIFTINKVNRCFNKGWTTEGV